MKRPWIVAAVVMLAALVGTVGLGWNLTQQHASLRQAIADVDTALLERVQAAQQAKQAAARLAEAKAFEARLVSPADLPGVLFAALNRAETAGRAKVTEIAFGNPKMAGGLVEREVVIKGDAESYDGLRAFLAALEQSPFASLADPVTFSLPKAGARVSFNLTLHLYQKP